MKSKYYCFLPYDWRRIIFAVLHPNKFIRSQRRRKKISKKGYSYKSFDLNKCIFVHIPKAAGVSVSKSLFGNLGGGHTTVAQYQLIFSEKDFESYYKFTFVRNPWDRLASAYHFLCKGGMNNKDKEWAQKHLDCYADFTDFIKNGLIKPEIQDWLHFKHQWKFVIDPCTESIAVDFVGRFESLDEGFDCVSRNLKELPQSSLVHINKSRKRNEDYRSMYTNETREIVNAIYRKDIELFGYEFDEAEN